MKEMLIAMELEKRIINHVARYNDDYLSIVKEYHMDEIKQIRAYMMQFIGDCIEDARMLNASFHHALIDLDINATDLLIPKMNNDVSVSSRITM